jgi:hypothetical protein
MTCARIHKQAGRSSHGADRNPADFVPLDQQNGQKPD